MMEYIFPGRGERKPAHSQSSHLKERMERGAYRSTDDLFENALVNHSDPKMLQRSSAEVPRSPATRYSFEENRLSATTYTTTRLSATRSFSDLRQASRQNSTQKMELQSPYLQPNRLSRTNIEEFGDNSAKLLPVPTDGQRSQDDATEMKSRSSQNTFVLVKISRCVLTSSIRNLVTC